MAVADSVSTIDAIAAKGAIALATSLAPIIGYDLASKIAKKSLSRGESVYNVCITMLEEIQSVSPELNEAKIKQILNPKNMI